MKNVIVALFLAAALVCALVSCTQPQPTPADSKTEPGTKAPPASTDEETDEVITLPEDTDAVTEPAPIVVNVGTEVEYKMAFYLDETKLSDGEKFVQNISNGFMRIDNEFMLNDEDTYQLFWTWTEVGETMTIPISVPAAGNYAVKAVLFNGGDYGIYDVFLGETKIASEVDTYNTEGGLYDYDFGSVDLAEGSVDLIIRREGQNESSAGSVFAISSLTLTCNSLA
ncbi:MAG: hypothetical protein J6Z80_04920 [Clostridia bacterium]|nr:hypothetical protein [Clostridia bacterium]